MPPKSARLIHQQGLRKASFAGAPPASTSSAVPPPPSSAAPPASTSAGAPPPSTSASPTPVAPPSTSVGASPPPPAPPLLGAPPSTSATPDNDAPAKERLSIRCKSKDGVVPIKRRTIVSNKTQVLMKTSGKIKVEWSSFHSGPSSTKIHNLLVRDIGAAAKSHVPMLAPTFDQLEDHQKDAIATYLENYYEIQPDDEQM